MIEILIGLLVPVLIVGAMIFIFVRRGLQMRELCEQGVETSGEVVEMRVVKAGKSSTKQRKIVYRYTDSAGATHSHTSVVSIEAYQNHEEGGQIQVVYSSKNPAISAPKYLVDQARKALGK